MIKATNVSKTFGDIKAVDNVSAVIEEGAVFGLIGTNGAGKSTFLRMVAGILKPEEGSVSIDEEFVFENEAAKHKLFYISDEQFFFPNATPLDMKRFYQAIYPEFDGTRFVQMLDKFELSGGRKMNSFSKGMKKQVSILLGLCANTPYLLCDETFDGLDPVMRQAVKSIFVKEIEERNLTPVIASHNLRELEDICDHIGLLHRGGILLSKDLEDMKLNIHKLQCVFQTEEDLIYLRKVLEILQEEQRGSLITITVRGTREYIEQMVIARKPIFYELLPLSLEEIFISETEVAGYDIKSLIL